MLVSCKDLWFHLLSHSSLSAKTVYCKYASMLKVALNTNDKYLSWRFVAFFKTETSNYYQRFAFVHLVQARSEIFSPLGVRLPSSSSAYFNKKKTPLETAGQKLTKVAIGHNHHCGIWFRCKVCPLFENHYRYGKSNRNKNFHIIELFRLSVYVKTVRRLFKGIIALK